MVGCGSVPSGRLLADQPAIALSQGLAGEYRFLDAVKLRDSRVVAVLEDKGDTSITMRRLAVSTDSTEVDEIAVVDDIDGCAPNPAVQDVEPLVAGGSGDMLLYLYCPERLTGVVISATLQFDGSVVPVQQFGPAEYLPGPHSMVLSSLDGSLWLGQGLGCGEIRQIQPKPSDQNLLLVPRSSDPDGSCASGGSTVFGTSENSDMSSHNVGFLEAIPGETENFAYQTGGWRVVLGSALEVSERVNNPSPNRVAMLGNLVVVAERNERGDAVGLVLLDITTGVVTRQAISCELVSAWSSSPLAVSCLGAEGGVLLEVVLDR
jgi:hypothetical protein